MAKLIEFDNILEFKKYVSQLKNEDILSFSYKDWVLLFESIERLNEKLLNEEDFEELKKVFSKGENVDNIEDGEFFANYICPDEFSKLYANFYLKTDDWRISKNIAQEIAKELYEKNVDLANVLVNINAKISMVEKTDRAALKTTKYHYLYDDALEVMKSKTLVFEKVDAPSSGTTCYKTLNTEITINDMSDRVLNTTIHEGIHSHFQQNTALQRHIKQQNFIPAGISKDLSDLFAYNQKYYMHFEKNILGYSKQPIEFFAKLVGALGEREFRKLSNQPSERNFIMLNNYFCNELDVNSPLMAHYNKNMIEAIYSIDNLDKISNFRKKLPKELKEKIKVYKSKSQVKVCIDTGFECSSLLKKHCKAKIKGNLLEKNIKNSLLKRVPFIGFGVGFYLALKRIYENKSEFHIASYEFSSGALSTMDLGIGSFVGFMFDAFMHKYDEAHLDTTRSLCNNAVYKKQDTNNKILEYIKNCKSKLWD